MNSSSSTVNNWKKVFDILIDIIDKIMNTRYLLESLNKLSNPKN
jgi:hypothetical protein